ncbi:MAG: sugar transferase [Fimbriimonas sp.]
MGTNLYAQFLKRPLDVIASSIALLLLAPIFLVVAILIKATSAGPVFFNQIRAGKGGRPITVFKFRTMTDKPRVANREILPGDAEVTSVGEVLRRFKIDEVPQFINVFKGDMSIVGPRPFLTTMVETLDDTGRVRLEVRPGLTGLAQVNGNIYLSWPERFVFDAQYVRTMSFLLDVKIVLKTLSIILKGEKSGLAGEPKEGSSAV